MALYEFICRECESEVTVEQSMAEELPTTHEECGGELRRIWSAPPVRFRGGGYYSAP